jgi:hypothetical protein
MVATEMGAKSRRFKPVQERKGLRSLSRPCREVIVQLTA